jgi:hypothetical protein
MNYTGLMHGGLRPFPKRWRFVAELHGPCFVYKWVARSSAFVAESHDVEQWPELRLQPGRLEVESNGPDDLQLVALVRLDLDTSAPMHSVIGFVREPVQKGSSRS